MDKLKEVLKEYGRWTELSTYVDRIETHIVIDFSHSLENAKALLESVGKQAYVNECKVFIETDESWKNI